MVVPPTRYTTICTELGTAWISWYRVRIRRTMWFVRPQTITAHKVSAPQWIMSLGRQGTFKMPWLYTLDTDVETTRRWGDIWQHLEPRRVWYQGTSTRSIPTDVCLSHIVFSHFWHCLPLRANLKSTNRFYVQYLNTPAVQTAIGAYVNFSGTWIPELYKMQCYLLEAHS